MKRKDRDSVQQRPLVFCRPLNQQILTQYHKFPSSLKALTLYAK